MTTLTEFLQLHIPRVSVPSVAQKFHHDQMVLIRYIDALYDEKEANAIWDGRPPSVGLVLSEALLFPVRADMETRDGETVEWAAFACERTLYDDDSGTYKTRTRFPDPDDIFLLLDAGVPLAYARAVTTPWGEYPTDKVVNAWREDMPIEYLSVALGS